MGFSGEHSGSELMAGLDDLRGLFEPKQFYASSTPSLVLLSFPIDFRTSVIFYAQNFLC